MKVSPNIKLPLLPATLTPEELERPFTCGGSSGGDTLGNAGGGSGSRGGSGDVFTDEVVSVVGSREWLAVPGDGELKRKGYISLVEQVESMISD